jgi:hypothetical protein
MTEQNDQVVIEQINPIVGYIFHSARQLGSDNAPYSLDWRYLMEGTDRIKKLVQEVRSEQQSGELEYFRSLLATLEAGDTALAIESVEGAIRVLENK